jgi:hypothetical protein
MISADQEDPSTQKFSFRAPRYLGEAKNSPAPLQVNDGEIMRLEIQRTLSRTVVVAAAVAANFGTVAKAGGM